MTIVGSGANDPYYIVLCTDVSGSMNESDPPYRDREGKLTTLRDDAQLTFLTLLGECPIESLIGVCKFSDRITGGLPGGATEVVSADSALVAWRSVGSNWESLREQLSTLKSNAGGTRIETALGWAHSRIALARQKSRTRGHGVIVLLSDGDPDRAPGELRGGVILDTARELAGEDIRVYSVIVNKASYRSGRTTGKLGDREAAAEQLMERMGSTTGGGTYRITATSGLLQIFLDIFRIVPTSAPILNAAAFDVSRYHRTIVFIGPMSPSIAIEPLSAKARGQTYSLPVQDGLDETSGIERRVIPLTLWNIIILKRPSDPARLDRYWSGTWRPTLEAGETHYGGRVYMITDFLLRLAMEPTPSCWAHEQVRVAAHLVERPRELGEQGSAAAPLRGGNLSLSFRVNRGPAASPLTVGLDKWDASQTACRSQPFQLDAPGQYVVACECIDPVENRAISLGTFTTDLRVEPAPLSLVLHKASNDQILFPRGSDDSPDAPVKGGEQIYAELREQGTVPLRNVEAQLSAVNVRPSPRPFTEVSPGRRVTGPFELPRGDIRLAGQAEVRLAEGNTIRQLNLPGEFFYGRGDMGLTCQFSDARQALWVGEYHRQVLTVSVFPVFADAAGTVEKLFPRELSQATITFLDTPDGAPLTLPARCVLGMLNRERQQNALKLTATYSLESLDPVPPCRRCEISSGPVLSGLDVGKRQYAVLDAAQEGVLSYRVRQAGDDGSPDGIAETLAANEPISFSVKRAADQGIGDVVFEFCEQGSAADPNAVRVLVPLSGTAAGSQTERSMEKELHSDTNYDVYVYASVKPQGSDQELKLRLRGGTLRATERYLELQELAIGPAAGEDLSCNAMETIRIPLQAAFSGYRPGSIEHSRSINAFKDSCRLMATGDGDRQTDASASIHWTKAEAVASDGATQSYRLEGYGQYAPDAVGRHRVELTGEIEVPSAGGKLRSVRSANCRLFAKEPRFRMRVQESTPRGERLLFDSERLVSGGKPPEAIRNSYATQLRVALDFSRAVQDAANQPLKAGFAVKHRSPSENFVDNVFSREVEFKEGQATAEFTIDNPPLQQAGEYFVQLQAAGSGESRVEFATPVLVTIVDMNLPQEVIPARGFLTPMVRQWPFSYRVPIQSSWSFQPIDLRFEFQFAGMQDKWFEGVASTSSEGQLLVRAPDYLPACDSAAVGPMKFRLRYMGADRVTWESLSPIQIVKPCLEGMDLLWKRGQSEYVSEEPDARVKPPFALRVRPRFRSAAELQGWWSRQETRILIAKAAGGIDDGMCTAPEYLERLTQLAAAAGGSSATVRVFRSQNVEDEQTGIEVFREDAPRRRFWGLPRLGRRDVYFVLASASYEERPSPTEAVPSGTSAPSRVITEWTPSRAITVERPRDIPYMWWLILGATGVCVSAQATRRRWVPAPQRLGLSVHVRGEASVHPAKQNPTVADLDHETSWSDEMQMHTEYLSSRHPAWTRSRVRFMAWPAVSLSRLFGVRRRQWITIRPEVDRAAKQVQTALMCVWTGVGKKRGALWSSQGGLMDLPDPGETAEVGLNLTYRVNGNELTAPVTVCIRRA